MKARQNRTLSEHSHAARADAHARIKVKEPVVWSQIMNTFWDVRKPLSAHQVYVKGLARDRFGDIDENTVNSNLVALERLGHVMVVDKKRGASKCGRIAGRYIMTFQHYSHRRPDPKIYSVPSSANRPLETRKALAEARAGVTAWTPELRDADEERKIEIGLSHIMMGYYPDRDT